MPYRTKKPNRTLTGLATAAFAGLCLFSQASLLSMDINDVVELKKAQVGDSVILAQAAAEQANFHVKIDDIKRLKAAGASDALILGLMRSQAAPAATPAVSADPAPAPAPAVIAPAPAAQPAVIQAPVNQADLELEMLDKPDIDIAVNPETRTILLAPAGQLGAGTAETPSNRQAWRLAAGKRLSVVIPAGTYKVEWINEETSYPVNMDSRATTKLIFSTTSTKMYDAVYLSIFRGETRVDGGRLHMLEVKPAAFAPASSNNDYNAGQARVQNASATSAVIPEPPQNSTAYTAGYSDGYSASNNDAANAAANVQPQVVTRTVYVDQPVYVQRPVYYTPAPVYVYRPTYSTYCAPTYCAPRYYSSCNTTSYRSSYRHYDRGFSGVAFGTGSHGSYFGVGVSNRGVGISLGGRLDNIHFSLGGFFK